MSSTWKTRTHVLKFPVTLGEKHIAAVTVREPDVDALEAIEGLEIENGESLTIKQMRGLISALADCPSEAIGKMHRSDLEALGEVVIPLLQDEEEQTEEAPQEPSSSK
ncbi:phage tail assembly protein [Pararhizobium haloflavum]|uniref:phage tail assembly protein n=1 Tax=Pararhizobium haloflavum TaxID=2037914 RepID=UPI000C1A2102|nr:phage tail assembly protein [Pararhizobium haloflavum]